MPTKVLLYGQSTLCVDGAEFALNDSPLTTCVGRASTMVELSRCAESGFTADVVAISAHYRSAQQLMTDVTDCQRMFPGVGVVVFGCMLSDPAISIQMAALGATTMENPLRMAGFASLLVSTVANPSASAGKAARRVIGRPRSLRERGALNPSLSVRELQILGHVVDGLTNLAIAQRLDISDRTVKNHLYRVYQKLGVSSRGQAAVEAIRRGLVSP